MTGPRSPEVMYINVLIFVPQVYNLDNTYISVVQQGRIPFSLLIFSRKIAILTKVMSTKVELESKESKLDKDFNFKLYLYARSKSPSLTPEEFSKNCSIIWSGTDFKVNKWLFEFPFPSNDIIRSSYTSDQVRVVREAVLFPQNEYVIPSVSSELLALISPKEGSFIVNKTRNVPQLFWNGKWWDMSPGPFVST